MVFVPKAGGKAEQLPKSYRPINLSSLFLKTMDKLLYNYIRETYLRTNPIHNLQFIYQPGKSTVTAIHHITPVIEKDLEVKQILTRKETPPIIREWIREMLSTRVIGFDLCGSSMTISATRGCPQRWCHIAPTVDFSHR